MKIKTAEMKTPAIIAAGIAVTLIVVIVSGAAIRSLASKLGTNNQILSLKREAQQKMIANLSALEQLKTEYASLGPDRDLIIRAVPTTADFPALVAMMGRLSSNAGVGLTAVTPGAPIQSAAGASEYRFGVTLAANYDTFKQFLRNVEESLRPLAVVSYNIGGSEGALTVELQMATYFQPAFDPNIKSEPFTQPGQTSSPAPTTEVPQINSLNPSQGGVTP